MHEAVDEVIARRRMDPAGLNRALSTSLAVHFGAVLLVLVIPKIFPSRVQPNPMRMTISLSGSGGERSGGMVAAGARPVEQVAPQPKRSEPIPPATPPKSTSLNLSAKPPIKTTPVPTPTSTPTTTTRPPTTGAQTRSGTSAAETGQTTNSTGLSFGGTGAGDTQVTLDTTFCCPIYIGEMQRRILAIWRKDAPEVGTVTVVFEINKDGSFSPPQVEKSGGVVLDIQSLDVFKKLQLQPLPKEYTADKLKIHLTFPYVR